MYEGDCTTTRFRLTDMHVHYSNHSATHALVSSWTPSWHQQAELTQEGDAGPEGLSHLLSFTFEAGLPHEERKVPAGLPSFVSICGRHMFVHCNHTKAPT